MYIYLQEFILKPGISLKRKWLSGFTREGGIITEDLKTHIEYDSSKSKENERKKLVGPQSFTKKNPSSSTCKRSVIVEDSNTQGRRYIRKLTDFFTKTTSAESQANIIEANEENSFSKPLEVGARPLDAGRDQYCKIFYHYYLIFRYYHFYF